MIRGTLTEFLPFLASVVLVTVTTLYTPLGLPALLVVGVLYGFYRKLARMEYYLSEECREALFWRDRNRFLFEGFKWASAVLLVGALYTNYKQDDQFVQIDQRISNGVARLARVAMAHLGVDRRIKTLEQSVRRTIEQERHRAVEQSGKIATRVGGDVKAGLPAQQSAPEPRRTIPSVTPERQTPPRRQPETTAKKQPAPARPAAQQTEPKKDAGKSSGLPFDVRKTGEN